MPLASVGIVDLLAKRAAFASLVPGERRTIVPGLLDVTLVENTRGAMGLFGRHPTFLVALACAVLILVGVLSRRALARSAFAQVGFGLIAGGALGNVVDRLTHGYVIDFLSVPHFFVFNVADAAVTAGVVLIALPALARDRAAARA